MKIRQKITLFSSIIFAVILGLTSIIIFIGFSRTSDNTFFLELARTAEISALFFLEEDELEKDFYVPISEAFYSLRGNEVIAIYDENYNIAFNTEPLENVPTELLEEIRNNKTYNFQIGDYYFSGLYYEDNQGEFIILVRADNPILKNQERNLLLILLSTFFLGMIILIFTTNRVSRLVYLPVRNVIDQVNSLNLNKNPLLLEYPKTNDELEELFQAFNSLLIEIERTYGIQKNFIDHASHELKTPLAGIINDLEITMLKERSVEVYQKKFQVILSDAVRLKLILDKLLLMSELERNKIKKPEIIRVDEVFWDALEQLSKKYSPERFIMDIKVPPESFSKLSTPSNATVLYIAVYNFLDNAAKFSSTHVVKITFLIHKGDLKIEIEDKGIGISQEDIKLLEQPFHRGKNAIAYEGNGLGLSIALKILKLYNIDIKIESGLNQGTKVSLFFQN